LKRLNHNHDHNDVHWAHGQQNDSTEQEPFGGSVNSCSIANCWVNGFGVVTYES
jgi:hypothetical protein